MRNPKILVLEKDDSLAEQVRGVAAELRPRPEVVTCDRATAVEDAVNADGPFDVMIAGPSLSTKTGLASLQAIHDEAPATSLVLAFASGPTPPCATSSGPGPWTCSNYPWPTATCTTQWSGPSP